MKITTGGCKCSRMKIETGSTSSLPMGWVCPKCGSVPRIEITKQEGVFSFRILFFLPDKKHEAIAKTKKDALRVAKRHCELCTEHGVASYPIFFEGKEIK